MAKIKCPECGTSFRFYVDAKCSVELDGAGYVEECDNLQWEGTTPCVCAECYHEGMYKDFYVYEED